MGDWMQETMQPFIEFGPPIYLFSPHFSGSGLWGGLEPGSIGYKAGVQPEGTPPPSNKGGGIQTPTLKVQRCRATSAAP